MYVYIIAFSFEKNFKLFIEIIKECFLHMIKRLYEDLCFLHEVESSSCSKTLRFYTELLEGKNHLFPSLCYQWSSWHRVEYIRDYQDEVDLSEFQLPYLSVRSGASCKSQLPQFLISKLGMMIMPALKGLMRMKIAQCIVSIITKPICRLALQTLFHCVTFMDG